MAPVLANPPDKLVVVYPTILIGIGLVSQCFTVRQYILWVFALLKTTYYLPYNRAWSVKISQYLTSCKSTSTTCCVKNLSSEEWEWTTNGRWMDRSKCNDFNGNFQFFQLSSRCPFDSDPSKYPSISGASGSLSTWWHITSFTRRQRSVPRLPRCSLLVQHVEKLRPIQHLRTFGNCKAPIEKNVQLKIIENWYLENSFAKKKDVESNTFPQRVNLQGIDEHIYLLRISNREFQERCNQSERKTAGRSLPIPQSIQNLNIWASQHHHHSDHALRRLPLPQRIVFGVHKCCWYPLEIFHITVFITIEIVNFPMKNGGSFHRFLYVYQIYQILQGSRGLITAFKSSCAPGGMTGNVRKAVTSHKWNKIAYMFYNVL